MSPDERETTLTAEELDHLWRQLPESRRVALWGVLNDESADRLWALHSRRSAAKSEPGRRGMIAALATPGEQG